MEKVLIQKVGSVTSRLGNFSSVNVLTDSRTANVGDVVAVRALSESTSYGNLELPSGRLAKINRGDILLGALGKRRALKGFVGNVPPTIAAGDRLHLLNMGGVVGICEGHHSSFSDAIELTGNTQASERGVHYQAETLAGEVLDHGQDAEAPAGGERVSHEVDRPAQVGSLRDRHRGPRPQRPLATTTSAHRQTSPR